MKSPKPNKPVAAVHDRRKAPRASKPAAGVDDRRKVRPEAAGSAVIDRRDRSKRKPLRPVVAATFAMTVDGKITTRTFSPVDFTSREDKLHLLRQRSLGDAVLIGRSTLSHDNVRLGVPDPKMRAERAARGQAPYPLRVIVSNEGRIDPELKIFQSDFSRIIIFSTTRMPRKYQAALRQKATLRLTEARRVNLVRMLQVLRSEYHVRWVACEGGAELFRGLLELRLIDRLNLTIAPYIFGGKGAPTLTGRGTDFLPATVQCSLVEMRVVGEECFLQYRVKYRAPKTRARGGASETSLSTQSDRRGRAGSA
ncbi:MAG: RibD family protein [Chthoniobacterales bacterium]